MAAQVLHGIRMHKLAGAEACPASTQTSSCSVVACGFKLASAWLHDLMMGI